MHIHVEHYLIYTHTKYEVPNCYSSKVRASVKVGAKETNKQTAEKGKRTLNRISALFVVYSFSKNWQISLILYHFLQNRISGEAQKIFNPFTHMLFTPTQNKRIYVKEMSLAKWEMPDFSDFEIIVSNEAFATNKQNVLFLARILPVNTWIGIETFQGIG